MQPISFFLNGRSVEVSTPPGMTLIELLRDKLGLNGSKRGCGEGECGVCTVLIEKVPIYACLYPANKVNGLNVETIEGLSNDGKLHPLQESFINNQAIQCGFCTPGMLMTAKSVFDNKQLISRKDIRREISGNLCRCACYNLVIDAIQEARNTLNNRED